MFAIEIYKMSGLFSFGIYKDIWTKLYLQYWLVPFWIASNEPYFLKTSLKGRKIMFSIASFLFPVLLLCHFLSMFSWKVKTEHYCKFISQTLIYRKGWVFKNLFNHYIYSQMMFACCWTKAWYYTITTFCLRWLAWLI